MVRPVRVMRWDDPGAPQRSPADAAAIVDILKKCLVEGYGTTDPLGWTLEYEDAPGGIVVFRNSPANGSGGYVRVSPYTTPTGAYILTQSAMSATGSEPENLFNPGYLNSIPADANLTRWVLIGDDRAFYLLLHHNTSDFLGTTMSVCMFIGDFNPVIPTDVATFICTGANANSTSSRLAVGFTSTNTGPVSYDYARVSILSGVLGGDSTRCRLGVPSSVSGAGGYTQYALYCAGELGASFLTSANSVDFPVGGLVQPIAIKRDIAPTNSLTTDTDNPYLRGYLPGIMSLGWKTHHSAAWPAIKSIDGKQYVGVAVNSSSSSHGGVVLWVNIEDWE